MHPLEISHLPPDLCTALFTSVSVASIKLPPLFLHFPLWPARGQWRPALEAGFPMLLDRVVNATWPLWEQDTIDSLKTNQTLWTSPLPPPLQLGIMWAWWEGLPSSSSSSSSSLLLRIPGTRTGEWGQKQKLIPSGCRRNSLAVPKGLRGLASTNCEVNWKFPQVKIQQIALHAHHRPENLAVCSNMRK